MGKLDKLAQPRIILSDIGIRNRISSFYSFEKSKLFTYFLIFLFLLFSAWKYPVVHRWPWNLNQSHRLWSVQVCRCWFHHEDLLWYTDLPCSRNLRNCWYRGLYQSHRCLEPWCYIIYMVRCCIICTLTKCLFSFLSLVVNIDFQGRPLLLAVCFPGPQASPERSAL